MISRPNHITAAEGSIPYTETNSLRAFPRAYCSMQKALPRKWGRGSLWTAKGSGVSQEAHSRSQKDIKSKRTLALKPIKQLWGIVGAGFPF